MRTKKYNTQQMLDLQKAGHNKTEIAKICGCSRLTVLYHLNPKHNKRAQAQSHKWNKANKDRPYHPYKEKANSFQTRKSKPKPTTNQTYNELLKTILWKKVYNLSRKKIGNKSMHEKPNFTAQDVIDKFGEQPVCALTGRQLDIQKTKSYHFDHKIPTSKGGDNSIDNLQLLHRDVNMAKNDMTNEQFLALCKEVLEHNNYRVDKL